MYSLIEFPQQEVGPLKFTAYSSAYSLGSASWVIHTEFSKVRAPIRHTLAIVLCKLVCRYSHMITDLLSGGGFRGSEPTPGTL
jgi:hypothetical protein